MLETGLDGDCSGIYLISFSLTDQGVIPWRKFIKPKIPIFIRYHNKITRLNQNRGLRDSSSRMVKRQNLTTYLRV